MKSVFERIAEFGLMPVVKLESSARATDLAKALIDGGLPAAEITFRSDAAEEAIKKIKKEYPDLLVGAGTVLTVETVKSAVDAGAEFIVAPGFNPRIVDYCLSNDIPVIPGVNSPGQIEQALERGLKFVKFFPAENSGGIKMLKALAAPYSDIHFMPTGGINSENIADYLAFDRVLACGGSWMVKSEKEDFSDITLKTKEAVAAVLGFRLKSLSIYPNDDSNLQWNTDFVNNILGFGLPSRQSEELTSLTIDSREGKEAKGLITLEANRLKIARSYFERNGLSIDEKSVASTNGRLTRFRLKEQLASFDILIEQFSNTLR